MEIYKAESKMVLKLPYAEGGVRGGFPSPAQDYITESIDLNRELIQHPASTFYAKVVGDSMAGEGITEGDIVVVDRSIEPEHGDLAVCCLDGEFTLKRLYMKRDKVVCLIPSNRKYKPIEIKDGCNFMVWGVVLYTIKSNRRRRIS